MEFLTVTIKTLSPVVLTAMNNAAVMTESRDFISGSVLRGVLASRYITVKNLGVEAHKDKCFREMFFEKLRFVDAYPVKDGKRSFVLPLSLQKAKIPVKVAEHGEKLLDVLYEKPEAGYKAVKGFGIANGNILEKVSVHKQVKLHMSRSNEQERLSGRSLEGGIYNYEAIASGQEFQGLILGEAGDLQKLVEALDLPDKKMDCRIGRSKYTEYGHCSLEIGGVENSPECFAQGKYLHLRLETAWLPMLETAADAETMLGGFLEKVNALLCAEDIKIGKVITQTEKIANFVGIWGLKRPEQQALAAGSVFTLYKESGWTVSDLEQIEKILFEGQGARTEEGFGQLRVWNMPGAMLQDNNEEGLERKKVSSPVVKKIAASILLRRVLTMVKLQAEQDVQQLRGNVADANHSFARLENLLGERKNLENARERFQNKLQDELRQQSILDKKLQNLTLRGQELKDILAGKAPMPYKVLDFKEEVPVALAEDVCFELPSDKSGVVFYEYWLWFFRHGRKFAIARKGDK